MFGKGRKNDEQNLNYAISTLNRRLDSMRVDLTEQSKRIEKIENASGRANDTNEKYYSHIEIRQIDGKPSPFTELSIDGHVIKGVRSVKFEHFAGEMPVLTVDLNALDISIDQTVLMYQKSIPEEMKITFNGHPDDTSSGS